MAVAELPRPLRGIIPPMITPLLDRDTLDVEGLNRLIEHLIAGGVNGIFVLGSTGEGPALSYRLRYELIERACRQVDGRVPVLIGITDTSFVESLNVAKKAADAGAQALVATAPYYYPINQADLLQYIEHLSAELPLPVFLYNMPSHTKLTFETDTVLRASKMKNVVGLKDTSGSMSYFHQLRALFADRPDFTLVVGPEQLLAESVLMGGHGGVCGGANLFPELYVNLYNAAQRGDLGTVRTLHQRVMRLHSTIYSLGEPSGRVLKCLKTALFCRGICNDFVAEPHHPFGSVERDRMKELVAAEMALPAK